MKTMTIPKINKRLNEIRIEMDALREESNRLCDLKVIKCNHKFINLLQSDDYEPSIFDSCVVCKKCGVDEKPEEQT